MKPTRASNYSTDYSIKHKAALVEVHKKIRKCRRERLNYLEIGHNEHLDVFPEEIKRLTWLTNLSVVSTGITAIPDWICNLRRLTIFHLEDNKIISLPDSIGKLKRLKTITLECNRLQTLPETFGDLPSLERFLLTEMTNSRFFEKEWGQSSWFTRLPDSFCNLKSLKHFSIENTRIEKLPENFGNLTSLKSLCIQGDETNNANIFFPDSMKMLNKLKKISLSSFDHVPVFISALNNLTYLDLSHNKFYELPDFIGTLRSLKTLNLHSTWITRLPEWIANLKNLVDLDISSNDISVDTEILAKLPKLKNY